MTWLLLAEAGVPEGGLFDLDATLPLMAVQVVLLTFLLNSLFFRPVGKVVEDREGYITTAVLMPSRSLLRSSDWRLISPNNFVVPVKQLRLQLLRLSRKLIVCIARLWPKRKLKPIAPVNRPAVRSRLSVSQLSHS